MVSLDCRLKLLDPTADRTASIYFRLGGLVGLGRRLDDAMDRACKVLRLLHITDLRDLQTRINELIVKVQSLTADPKTNM